MKKNILNLVFVILFMFILASCFADNLDAEELEEVKVVDSDGLETTVYANPTKIAVYDYAILDILYNVGFDKLNISQIVVPAKDNLPPDLKFYKEQSNDKVISGGSLFYLDYDALDIVQPQVVILGARSFGMNANGDRLNATQKEEYANETLSKYNQTRFVKLSMNSSKSQLLKDMKNNVEALKKIFPNSSGLFDEKLTRLETKLNDIRDIVQSLEVKALFAMMVDQTTLSVFNPNSRFDMLYEEFGFLPAADKGSSWDDSHGLTAATEYVYSIDPEVIFVLDRSATVGSGAGYENFLNDASIKNTTAYKNNNIFALSGDSWYTMTGGFTATEKMIENIRQFIDK